MSEETRAAIEVIEGVKEIPASAGALYAASNLLGSVCGSVNNAFVQCKANLGANPALCVRQGVAVTNCTLNLFRDVYASPCAQLFTSYTAALEKYNLEFDRVRAEEDAFNKCWEQQKQ